MTSGMTDAYDWHGRNLIGADGETIGKIDDLYRDQGSDRPEWARVTTGLFGSRSSFVPLAGARPQGEDVRIEVTKDQVKHAPHVGASDGLSQEQEIELYRHYGIDYTDEGTVTPRDDRGERWTWEL